MSQLAGVEEVQIDEQGIFKYVYIRVYEDGPEDSRDEKDIVRGFNWAEYHADIYDRTDEELGKVGLDCECLGGGRIIHKPAEKYIKVYGYSMGFGRADHARTVEKIKAKYPGYTVEWSDEGY